MKLVLWLLLTALSARAQALRIYAIDTEGGKATLYVTPTGESMLIDTGYDGNDSRDANRIAAAAAAAGVKRINHLVITHFHSDHMGGLPQLLKKLPVDHIYDHGESVEGGKSAGRGGDVWAGKIDIGDHSLRLLPQPDDHRATSEIDAAQGTVLLVVEQGPYRLELRSIAELADFYYQITPSQTVFDGQLPVMKTMNAALDIALFLDGIVVERAALPQSILEFAGVSYRFVGQERGQ